MFDEILQGKGLIMILVLLLTVALAPWYGTNYQLPRSGPHSEKKPNLPDLPSAFTGRSNEVHMLAHYLVTEHVSIVAVTGGPGYGKSSVAIVSSREIARLGIPVYYVSLSEVNSLKAFIMAFMHTLNRKGSECMPERADLLSWVASLETTTVVILDNADLLTLRQTDLRNEFLKLLKDTAAGSVYIHLVVATRYRFKFVNDFAEIHLDPLTNVDAVALLRSVVLPLEQTGNEKGSTFEDQQLKDIANKTGGIPLALKAVGILLKLGIVSTAEVLEELAVDPLHALSRESFTPEEQLQRCFDLSYKYLSPNLKECLNYATEFPGSFDRRARDAIVGNMTGDSHCMDQLVDRSLVEYSSVEERYTMHSLLRSFVTNLVKEQPHKDKYNRLFCSHFTRLLSARITEARSGVDVNPLYTTIAADYHNFLHLFYIYTKGSKHHTCLAHKDMLLFANQAFDVVKLRFPWEILMDWWTAVLKNVCRRMLIAEFEQLATRFLQLSTKFGYLLLYHKQYQPAGNILLFADQCVNNTTLAASFATCQHPQADVYTSMLQALMKAYEEDQQVHKALQLKERIHLCIDLAPDKKPEELIPNDFCTVGIVYLQEKHSQDIDFDVALQLFDAHYKCSNLSERADELIKMLEDAYDVQTAVELYLYGKTDSNLRTSRAQFERALSIAKRCNMVRKYRMEAAWLMKAAEFTGVTYLTTSELFRIHFRLTRLQWLVFDDAEKAIEHGKVAYTMAINNPDNHGAIWAISTRLGDMLHQVDGSEAEAGFYFEAALNHLPFVDLDKEFMYECQKFAEIHLISIYINAGEHRRCIQHYGQWAKLEVANASDQARKIVDSLFSELMSSHEADARSLTVMDSSLDWLLGDVEIAKRFFEALIQRTHASSIYFARGLTYIIFILSCAFTVIKVIVCIYMVGNCVSCLTLRFTQIPYFIFLLHFNFHYFIFFTLTKHKGLWVPRQLPQFDPPITWFYAIIFILSTGLATLALCLTSFFGIYLLKEQAAFVYSPSSLYHNLSMHIINDEFLYQAYP